MAAGDETRDETVHDETAGDGAVRTADVLASLKDAADALVEEQKKWLAEAVRGFAQALRRSADAFADEAAEGGGSAVARAAGRIAAEVEDFSAAIEERPWRAVLADLEEGARIRPELFFAGALAAGFLVGRLVAGAGARRTAET
jgi:hypothetical protein